MSTNRRKLARQPMQYPAKIVANDGSWGRNCRVVDISDGGAKLETERPLDVPKDFILALSTRGKALRHCHVMWADGCEIGVKFDPQGNA